MNLEKKAAIIGAIWGLISYWIFQLLSWPYPLPILQPFLAFPYWFVFKILGIEFWILDVGMYISIIIGALIGYGIAKIYLKVKK